MIQTHPDSNIYTIDAQYLAPFLASVHLIVSQGRVALVDTGTQYSISQVSESLTELNLTFSHIDYIILTHIHLDHAGGASALMKLCDNATLVVHPKGARHMVDPSKLVAGASAVYGEAKFKELYGTIEPIDEKRILQPIDGDTIELAGRRLTFIDTPGHANHHHCIIDEQTRSIFTGDTMGVGYPALRNQHHAFVAPTTTPVQFNPQALHASIDRIMSHDPSTLYLTHYGALTPSLKMVAGLHEQIDDFVLLTEQAAEADDDFEAELVQSLSDYLVRRCLNEVDGIDENCAKQWLAFDAKLNAQGLFFWYQHRRTA